MKLLTHLYFGDPSKEFSLHLAKTLLDSGADGLEIGIPYSDPVCDGPVFQAACKRALQNNIAPQDVFDGIKQLRRDGYTQPIYITTYYAPIFAMGEDKFIAKAKECDAQGLIIPDLLLEEQVSLQNLCTKNKLSLIQFATPYTTANRLQKVLEHAQDFLYCIGAPSVTGKTVYSTEQKVALIKKTTTSLPLMIGFGISQPSEVKQLIKAGASGVIVGSSIARMYEKNLNNPEQALSKISSFIKELKKATMEAL